MLFSNNLGSSSNKPQSSKSLINSSKSRLSNSSTSASFKITCNSSFSSPKLTSAFAWLGPDREPFDIWTQEPLSDEPTLRARSANICDCLDSKCLGCFYPCSVCKSSKCSGRIQEPTPFVFDLFWDHRLRDIFKYQTENRGSLQSCKRFRDWVVYKVQDSFSSRARWLDPKKDASYKATVETVCTLPSIKHCNPQPTASFFAGDQPHLPPDAPDDLTDPRDLAIDRFLREKRGKRDACKASSATPQASSALSSSSSAKPSASSSFCASSSPIDRGLSHPPAKIPRILICSPGDAKGPFTSNSHSLGPPTVASSVSAFASASASATATSTASSTIANRSLGPIEIEDNDPIIIDETDDD